MRILLLSSLLLFSIACGETAEENNGAGNNGTDISEILPAGYDRVSSARICNGGTRIGMIVERDDEYHLITTSLTGTAVAELSVEGLSYLTTIAWAADDSAIYFSGDGISRIPTAGGETEKIVDAFAVASFDVSHDNKLIAWAINGGTTLSIADLSTLPVVTADAVTVAKAKAPRFSPDSTTLLTIVDTEFATVNVDGTNLVTHAPGADYLSNGSWIDNDSFLFLGDKKIKKFEVVSKKTSVVSEDGFATLGLDYNDATNKYTFLINGSKPLQIRNF